MTQVEGLGYREPLIFVWEASLMNISRTVLIVALLTSAQSALGETDCPNLDGTYMCWDGKNRSRTVTFKSYLKGRFWNRTPFYNAQFDSLRLQLVPGKDQWIDGCFLGMCAPHIIQYHQSVCEVRDGVSYLRVATYPAIEDETSLRSFKAEFYIAGEDSLHWIDFNVDPHSDAECFKMI